MTVVHGGSVCLLNPSPSSGRSPFALRWRHFNVNFCLMMEEAGDAVDDNVG